MIKNAFTKFQRQLRQRATAFVFDSLMAPPKSGKGRTPFGSEELRLVRRALLSQNLCCIGGEMVPALEREFAVAYGLPYAIASTSGTAAIHVALGALDLNPGDEVITAPITDLGSIIPILYQNAIPVFADIDDTYTMDPAAVEQKISPRTRAILLVHLFGNPCNMDAMTEIAKRHEIPLIEDCSQAHMTKYRGRYVGTIGDIGCFSFQQSKQMTTGDGGMTITGNRAYYDRMKLFADKGYARKGWGPRAYLFHAPNYRMTELVGAVGLAQLKKVRSVVEKRWALGQHMTGLLGDIPSIRPAPVTPGGEHSYWMYPIRVDGVDIDHLATELREDKVPVLPGYTGKPIYLCSESLTAKKTYGDSQCPFTCGWTNRTYDYIEGLCPRAEQALEHLICIPWDESWNTDDVERVAKAIVKCMNKIQSKDLSSSSQAILSAPLSVDGTPSPLVTAKSQTDKVRIGIVGCGQMGRWHLDAYKRNVHCELVAFVDTDFDRARTFATEVNAKAYRSHEELIDRERLNGVSICTVPSTHRDIALDLLNAGVNVLCEKPLALSLAQADEMSETARGKDLLLLTAFKFRFFDEVLKAKELIEKGTLGQIVSFRLMFGGHLDMSGTWFAQREISGGGVIIDNAPHAADLIHYLLGEIKSVSAEIGNHQSIDVEDTAQLIVRLTNGIVGTVDLSWSTAVPSQAYLETYGEAGAALLDPEGISYRVKDWNDWRRIPNQLSPKDAFGRQMNHFIDAILRRRPLIVGNGDGLRSQAVIEATYESVRRGGTVTQIKYVG